MIEVANLSKRYGHVPAVRDLSFRVERGEVVGFLGPNGAGKTTTLRVLAGFLAPTQGHARIAGHDVVMEPERARRCIGYMPEGCPLYPELRVREYLSYRAQLKGIGAGRQREIDRVLQLARAGDVVGMLCGQLSRGYRQRVGLADALLGSPPLLILDEPTAGLDPNQVQDVREVLRSLAGKQTVLLSTHILSEVEATCDRAIVVASGRLVADGPIDELRRQGATIGRLRVAVRGDVTRIRELLTNTGGVVQLTAGVVDGEVSEWLLEAAEAPASGAAPDDHSTLAERVAARIAEARLGLCRLEPVGNSLEQTFSQLTRHGPDPTAPPADPAPEESVP